MKNAVLFLLLFVAVLSYGQEVAQAEQTQSYIVRHGDRYTVEGMTYINSTEFRGYLKNINPEVFAQYDKGFRIGMAGWGLLAYGTVMMPISAFMFIITRAHPDEPVTNQSTTYETYEPIRMNRLQINQQLMKHMMVALILHLESGLAASL